MDAGATLATSPEDVARNSDVVVCMLGLPSDVREVIKTKIIPNMPRGAFDLRIVRAS